MERKRIRLTIRNVNNTPNKGKGTKKDRIRLTIRNVNSIMFSISVSKKSGIRLTIRNVNIDEKAIKYTWGSVLD